MFCRVIDIQLGSAYVAAFESMGKYKVPSRNPILFRTHVRHHVRQSLPRLYALRVLLAKHSRGQAHAVKP